MNRTKKQYREIPQAIIKEYYDEKQEAIKARQRGEEMRDQFLEWYHTEIEDEAGMPELTRLEKHRKENERDSVMNEQ